jgi:TatD DNase family protein
MIRLVDTHAHLDGEEYAEDRDAVVQRAQEAGVAKVFIPAIDLKSVQTVFDTCSRYPGYCYPMVGLHPEEVRADWREQLSSIKEVLVSTLRPQSNHKVQTSNFKLQTSNFIAIGEVGLDFYWSREFEHEQMEAFEEQVRWSVETRLPLMIHCRKAQNEMVRILNRYASELPGGVFHCFTGNAIEAEQLLQFPGFVLGIGGVLTFKKATLPQTLAEAVPLDRLVIETDAPYMAPVPCRGQRNEPAYTVHVLRRLAEAYGVSEQEVADQTNATVARVFGVKI